MNKFKRTLLFTVAGAMAFTLQGCGEKAVDEEGQKTASITLACDYEGSEVERHQNVQFSFTVENLEESAVSYVVSSDIATITTDGKLTVSDSAEVGKEFSVYAKAGEVKSNEIAFTVKDTLPTNIELVASTTVIREDNFVEFGVRYTPTYATVKEYTLEATGENASLVEIVGKKLQLKSGASYVENIGKEVTVVATLTGDTTIKDDVTLKIGEAAASIQINNINMIVKQSNSYTVNPVLYGDEGQIVQPTRKFEFESSDTSVFVVSNFGKITPKGHGNATLTVKYGDLTETASVNVIISADSIEINNATAATLKNGMYFSKVDTYPLSIKNVSHSYSKVTEKYKFAFKLLDEVSGDVLASGDEVATVDSDLNITFKQVGKVQMDVVTDSSLNDVVVPDEYEESTTFMFNINEGVNVHNYTEMVAVLQDSNKHIVNFVNNVKVTAANVLREGGVGSATRYAGIHSRGDKYLYGNGYQIDLSTLELDPYMDDVNDDGADFIKFAPEVGKEHAPFTVQMFDLTLYGNTDYNGYDVKVDNPDSYSDPYNYSHWAFNKNMKYGKSFRTGFRVGYANEKPGFVDKNGKPKEEEFNGAYIKDFKMNNVTIRGFYWGLWTSHVIGTTENLHVYDCVEKGILNAQSQLTLNNTKFGQVGGFATEISLDGINNQGDITATNHGPTAGPNYNEKPFMNMTGSISVNNLNTGADTLYMQFFNIQLEAKASKMELDIKTVNGLVEMVFNNVYANAIAGGDATYTALLSAFWKSLITNGDKGQMNFFNLAFMFDLNLSGEGKQVADTYATYSEQGSAVTTIGAEMTKYLAAKKAGTDYSGYKQYEFIAADIAIPGAMYLGKVILSNFQYDKNYGK